MLIPFLIMLREGIEAALIVGIISSYLKHTNRYALMPAVWVGVLLAVAASLICGTILELLATEFPQKQQEFFEGIVGLITVVMLTYIVFWMRQVPNTYKDRLHASLEQASSPLTTNRSWALIGMVFLAVAREGLESVFFLLAIFQQSSNWSAPIGALLGIAASLCVGYAIYVRGMRLDLQRFFKVTSCFILFVAAGLLASSVRKFHEAGIWNHLQTVVFDLSDALPMDSPLGAILAGLLGYQAAPVSGEVIVYLAFLCLSVPFLLRPSWSSPITQ